VNVDVETIVEKHQLLLGIIGVRGGGVGEGGRPPGLENFQGKLCFQGNRNFVKNPE